VTERNKIIEYIYLGLRCLTAVCKLGRASFTDYSKATRVRKFYTANTGVIETNFLPYVALTFIYSRSCIAHYCTIYILHRIFYPICPL